jgi:hypothetical protein
MSYTSTKNFKFSYEGPVLEFDKVVDNHWTGTTYAPTEKKARSNLAYQFKKQFNRIASARIVLPGKIVQVD